MGHRKYIHNMSGEDREKATLYHIFSKKNCFGLFTLSNPKAKTILNPKPAARPTDPRSKLQGPSGETGILEDFSSWVIKGSSKNIFKLPFKFYPETIVISEINNN